MSIYIALHCKNNTSNA